MSKLLNTPLLSLALCFLCTSLPAEEPPEPPTINPFSKPSLSRDDAIPGYLELSDGSLHIGQIYLTRDKRLKIYDAKLERQREIPLSAIEKIETSVKKEWLEKEWKFKAMTEDEKMLSGRSYPAREYTYTVTLKNGRTIEGTLSALFYLQADATTSQSHNPTPPTRYILHQRDKGEMGESLDSLLYVKQIKLGEEAVKEAQTISSKPSDLKPSHSKPSKNKQLSPRSRR